MIDFASNFNYLGPPSGIDQLISENATALVREYADPDNSSAEEAAADYLGVSESCVAISQGSTEVIFSLPDLLDQDRAVMFYPTYRGYEIANERSGIPIVKIPLHSEDGFAFKLDQLQSELSKSQAAVYLCNPNNPTGNLIEKKDVLEYAREYATSDFIVDETYLQFGEDFQEVSLSEKAAVTPNLHVIHSFSKFFATPGIRAGALVSNEAMIEKFNSRRTPHTATLLSQLVLPWLLNQEDYIDEARSNMKARKCDSFSVFSAELGEYMDFTFPNANFIFASLQRAMGGSCSISEALATQGIAVRNGTMWGENYKGYFRFNIKDPQEETVLVDALKTLILQ